MRWSLGHQPCHRPGRVSDEIWNGEGLVLADTSAWIVARRVPAARDLFLAAIERGDVAWCWPVRYELMVDARGSEGIAALDRTLERLRAIAVDRAVQRGVLSAMREIASRRAAMSARSPRLRCRATAPRRLSGDGLRLAGVSSGIDHRTVLEPPTASR